MVFQTSSFLVRKVYKKLAHLHPDVHDCLAAGGEDKLTFTPHPQGQRRNRRSVGLVVLDARSVITMTLLLIALAIPHSMFGSSPIRAGGDCDLSFPLAVEAESRRCMAPQLCSTRASSSGASRAVCCQNAAQGVGMHTLV